MFLDLINTTDFKINKMKNIFRCFVIIMVYTLSSCVEIPQEGSIAPDVKYRNRKQIAISGTGQTIGDFEYSTSTLPMKFAIKKISETNNGDISSFSQEIPVVRYIAPIVGNETEKELRLKTDTVFLPALAINEHTGQIEIQEGNNIPVGEYHFDIEVSNTSGSMILQDAIIIEFKEYEVISYSRGMAQEPVIERVGDSPHQILFQGYLNGQQLHGNMIDFTFNREFGFKGTFRNDTPEGEVWDVNYPVYPSNTYCTWKIVSKDEDGTETVTYVSENFNFILGRMGNYVIKLFK